MLDLAKQSAFDKANDWVSAKNQLGHELSKCFNCVKGNWKFTRDGGAVGDFNLKGLDGVENVKIPSGAIIVNQFVFVKTAVTSGGSLTLDLNNNAANDGLAAAAVATLTLSAKIQGIPDFATMADAIVTTAERTLSLSFNVAAATAGELDVYTFYVF
jgi:hypothetical protein